MKTETDGVVEPVRGEDAHVSMRCKVKRGVKLDDRVSVCARQVRGVGTLSLPVQSTKKMGDIVGETDTPLATGCGDAC